MVLFHIRDKLYIPTCIFIDSRSRSFWRGGTEENISNYQGLILSQQYFWVTNTLLPKSTTWGKMKDVLLAAFGWVPRTTTWLPYAIPYLGPSSIFLLSIYLAMTRNRNGGRFCIPLFPLCLVNRKWTSGGLLLNTMYSAAAYTIVIVYT